MEELKQLGRYQIEAYLGSGAFADVYKALDNTLDRPVALKLLKPALLADEEAFRRFVKEARTGAGLIHPRIAWVLDMGEVNGRYFIAMRYVEGQSLDRILRQKGPLPWNYARTIIQQAGEALQFAHQNGLMHRDVKPQNIVISEKEGAILTDFGLVKAILTSGVSTHTGAVIGTPLYIPPEVWRDQAYTPAADQYALACVLVEILTGRSPYDASSPPAIMAKHFSPPELPDIWPASTPDSITNILQVALAQDHAQRYPSIQHFTAELYMEQDKPPKPVVIPVASSQSTRIAPPSAPKAGIASSRPAIDSSKNRTPITWLIGSTVMIFAFCILSSGSIAWVSTISRSRGTVRQPVETLYQPILATEVINNIAPTPESANYQNSFTATPSAIQPVIRVTATVAPTIYKTPTRKPAKTATATRRPFASPTPTRKEKVDDDRENKEECPDTCETRYQY